jgi:hypothetical protein
VSQARPGQAREPALRQVPQQERPAWVLEPERRPAWVQKARAGEQAQWPARGLEQRGRAQQSARSPLPEQWQALAWQQVEPEPVRQQAQERPVQS